MGVVAIFASVVAPLAVVAVLVRWAVPDSMVGLELSTEAAVMGEWRGSG